MMLRYLGIALVFGLEFMVGAPLPPLVCPAGGPIGSVDLRVSSPRGGSDSLPLRTINRLEEGDKLVYRPLLRSGEERKGEVTVVLVPANKSATGEKIVILEPKPANKPQEWNVPWRTSVVAYVYGPAGLNAKRVRTFLSRDDELVAQLADYAEKTAQTEALIGALASPNSSAASVQAALQGFSSQYGLNVQIDRTAPTAQQATTLFRTLNPVIATYDPISPQGGSQPMGQTAMLATSVAGLFFGSPVGLAAGGTAMLMELRSVAFPKAEFRSSFSQTMPNDGLGLCGRRNPAPPHTKVAYLWASRVPNVGPPQISVGKASSLPMGTKSPLPVTMTDPEWKVVDRVHNWALEPESGKPIPVKVQKLGDTKQLELDLGQPVKPGKYTLIADWDWDHFHTKGAIDVRPLSDFGQTRLMASSQDLLVSRTGKVPVTLEGNDFEFVTKVEIEKLNDKFAAPLVVPFVLPQGVRQGPQDKMDVQVNTIDMDPGQYKLIVTQLDGKTHNVDLKILPAPPRIANLPVVLNQGVSKMEFTLKGQRLDLLKRLELARGSAELGVVSADQTERTLRLKMAKDIAPGTTLALKAYTEDRSEPLTFSDAVRIVGPQPEIVEARVSQPVDQDVQLEGTELPGGMYLSAMMRVRHLQSNSVVKLGCAGQDSPVVSLRLGERKGALSFQQLTADQVFLSFDTGEWVNGCVLGAIVANGSEGESGSYPLGRVVRVPKIEKLEQADTTADANEFRASLTGESLETIEKTGWREDEGVAVAGIPLAVPGEATKQSLEIRLPPPPDPHTQLYVWLRGESKARATKIHP
jgi:hypothetical protein